MNVEDLTTVELMELTADGEMDEDYRRVLRARAARIRDTLAIPVGAWEDDGYALECLRALNAPDTTTYATPEGDTMTVTMEPDAEEPGK